jgi:hypothetical protein
MCRGKQRKRHHRCAAAPLLHKKREQREACRKRADHACVAPAIGRGDQAVNQAAEPERSSARPSRARAPLQGRGSPNMAQRDCDRGQRDERIDQEDPAPRSVVHDPSAEKRPNAAEIAENAAHARLAALAFSNVAPMIA